MPRQPRLDVPSLVHHVTARSVEGTDLFRDDRDRDWFGERLGEVVSEGGASVYAWALMTDHVHLLLRTGEKPLSRLMRRLLTGHAVHFNRRHGHGGPLFRGRYRSLVVEEEPYLLELVRYIHLNPVRAGLLTGMADLDEYPYTGHSVLAGRVSRPWQDTDGVFGLFSDEPGRAARLYRYFVAAGFDQGSRPDLAGTCPMGNPRRRDREARGDPRVLGGARFSRDVRARTAETDLVHRRDVEEVLQEVCTEAGLTAPELLGEGRTRAVARVRRRFLLQAVEECGTSCTALGRLCGRSHVAVLRAVEKARRERADRESG